MKRKLKMSKGLRYTMMSILILAVISFFYGAIREGIVEKNITSEHTTYQYTNNAEVTYGINLKENEIYDMNQLGEDVYYLDKYIKNIEITLEDIFSASIETNVKTSYEIVALVRAYTTEGEEKITIWEKVFEIQSMVEQEEVVKEQTSAEKITVNLDQYKAFIEHLSEAESLQTLLYV